MVCWNYCYLVLGPCPLSYILKRNCKSFWWWYITFSVTGFLCLSPVLRAFLKTSKCIENNYNIITVCRTEHTFQSLLVRTRQERNPLQVVHCICSIFCECGISCTGETDSSMFLVTYAQPQRGSSGKIKTGPVCMWKNTRNWSPWYILQHSLEISWMWACHYQ